MPVLHTGDAFFRRGAAGDFSTPHFLFQRKRAVDGPKETFLFWVLARSTLGRAKASLRSRPLGGWARGLPVLSAAFSPEHHTHSGVPSLGRFLGDYCSFNHLTAAARGCGKPFSLSLSVGCCNLKRPPDARRAAGATDTFQISGESNPRFCGAMGLHVP